MDNLLSADVLTNRYNYQKGTSSTINSIDIIDKYILARTKDNRRLIVDTQYTNEFINDVSKKIVKQVEGILNNII